MNDLPPQFPRTESAGPWWKLRAEWIYSAIVAGELRDHGPTEDVRYAVTREPLGSLHLPEGRLIAADPYVMEAEPEPFSQRLGADVAEVVAARARIDEGHERVAALILHAGSNPISGWVMATLPGQDVSTLGPESFFGYGVDAGTGSFGGPEAMKVAGRVLSADAGMLDDPVSEALFRDGLGTRSAVLVAPEAGAVPIAACSSGWGDGVYPTWLGLDASGSVMVAVTDFLLTSDPHAAPPLQEAPTPPAPEQNPGTRLRRWLGR